jgi:osmotically-inducible protein OsmY
MRGKTRALAKKPAVAARIVSGVAAIQWLSGWQDYCSGTRKPGNKEHPTMATLTNAQLHELVEKELARDPEITSTSIGVTAKDGVVTLTGFVPNYAAWVAAERSALRLHGVRAVANDLQVRLSSERIDPEIASDAAEALQSHLSVPSCVKAMVRNGYVTLEGTVERMFQRDAAEQAVRSLRGVKGVFNHITVKPAVSVGDVRAKIERALRRSAERDASHIQVQATNGAVTLSGYVRSFAEKQDAERASWTAPGVGNVINHLDIRV